MKTIEQEKVTREKVGAGVGVLIVIGLLVYGFTRGKKKLKPGGNTVKWTKGPTMVEDALADIADYVTMFLVLRADGVWITITADIWDSWAIPRDQICGIYVDRACAIPEGFIFA
ncbi:hypothetical protein ES705_18118 [subsurface metagenome]